MSGEIRSEGVKNESSWAGPARILVITLILAGGFIYYYFGPSVEDIQGNNPKASTSQAPVTVLIAGEKFNIPQNYTQFGKTRRGGVQDKVDLYAIMPDFEGFTIAHQDEFEGNAPNSPIVHLTFEDVAAPGARVGDEALTQHMTEREKFERIYLPLVVDPKGESARYGFTRYRLNSTYGKDQDLFVHEASDGGIVLYRCLEDVPTMPSPWCVRDYMLTDRLNLSYRFKRPRLSDWRAVDDGVTKLVNRFRQAGAPTAPVATARPPTGDVSLPAGPTEAAPDRAPIEAGTGSSAQPPTAGGDKVHKIDPNADPEPSDGSEPGAGADDGSDTPSEPLPGKPPG